jgi:hypothetical protein
VTGKAVPVQAGLWLLPLIALVGMQWRDHLIWAGFEATYFVAVWLYIAGLSKPDRGLPPRWYSTLLIMRLAAMLFLAVQVWRVARSRQPASPAEVVEGSEPFDEVGSADEGAEPLEEIDPLAGPMAWAPDAVLVRFG